MAERQNSTQRGSPAELLTLDEAAEFLGVSNSTMNNWRCLRRGPRFVKVGRCVRYRRSDIEAFITANVNETAISG